MGGLAPHADGGKSQSDCHDEPACHGGPPFGPHMGFPHADADWASHAPLDFPHAAVDCAPQASLEPPHADGGCAPHASLPQAADATLAFPEGWKPLPAPLAQASLPQAVSDAMLTL